MIVCDTKKIACVALMFFIIVFHAQAQPLSILFVTSHFPSRSQPFIKNEIKGMVDRGHDVKIFSISGPDGIEFSQEDKEVYQFHVRTVYYKFPYDFESCNVVVCEFGYNGRKILSKVAIRKWLENKKLLTTFRGADVSVHFRQDPHQYDMLFKRCDLVVTVCEYFKNRLITLGCDPHKIVVHRSAIDCSLFSSTKKYAARKDDKQVRFISVARLIEKKGIEYVIKAMALLVEKYPHISYIIVGDGPDAEKLHTLVQKFDLLDKIIFFGWADQKKVVKLLDESDIFILPSVQAYDGNQEGIPNSLKEAMMMCLPVISTNQSGIPELVEDGISGFLVDERDEFALAEKMAWFIEHKKAWKLMGRAGRRKIKQEYEMKKNAKCFEKLLYAVVRDEMYT